MCHQRGKRRQILEGGVYDQDDFFQHDGNTVGRAHAERPSMQKNSLWEVRPLPFHAEKLVMEPLTDPMCVLWAKNMHY